MQWKCFVVKLGGAGEKAGSDKQTLEAASNGLRFRLKARHARIRKASPTFLGRRDETRDEGDIEMLRLASAVCPFCEARAAARSLGPSWQHTRTAATLQKRKPNRMLLAKDVKRGPVARGGASRGGKRDSLAGPFRGMNVTVAPANLQPLRKSMPPTERRRTRVPVAKETKDARTPLPVERRRASRPGWKDEKQHKEKDPMHAMKMQRALTSISSEKRVRVKEQLAGLNSFDDFDLLPIVKEAIPTQALKGLSYINPTPIQRLAIPALLGTEQKKRRRSRRDEVDNEMKQFLLAAETGTGKTLAYILPVIDAIKRQEVAESAKQAQEAAKEEQEAKVRARNRLFEVEPPPIDPPDPNTARPRAIILLPTSELVDQVGAIVKSLSHTVKYRAALLSASYTGQVIRSRLFTTKGIDIVVTTPHLLHSITESDPNILSRVSHLVVDEADSLLDRSFSPVTSGIIDRAKPSLKQLIFCSATIPKSLDNYLQREYPQMKRLTTPNLHAIPRRVMMSVVDIDRIPFHGNRNLACAQVIWEIGKEGRDEEEEGWMPRPERKIVVFVNEREKTVELAEYLQSKGINATALNRDAGARKDENVLASFTGTGMTPTLPLMQQRTLPSPQSTSTMSAISAGDLAEQTALVSAKPSNALARSKQTQQRTPKEKQSTRTLPHTSVLVTTDLTSRGIDTLPVKHVILYDVPHTSIDFIHRLGRVGRMGKRGRGVVLVGRKDRKDIVREVREGMFRGMALI